MSFFILKFLSVCFYNSNMIIMKRIFSFSLFLLFYPLLMTAQEKAGIAEKYRYPWISLDSDPKTRRVLLYEVRDSSLILSTLSRSENYVWNVSEQLKIDYNNINYIIVKKKSGWKGALIGGLTGFAIGALLEPRVEHSILSVPPNSGEKITMIGATGGLFMIPGALIGGLIGGSVKITIPINRNLEEFKKSKETLIKYAQKN